MKAMKIKCLLVVIAGLALLATACVPPGGEMNQRATGAVSQAAQQEWKIPDGVEYCDVEPPNMSFESATFGFTQVVNNNPWRITQTSSMRREAEQRGLEITITDAQASLINENYDAQDLIAQGVDLLFLPPIQEEGFEPTFSAANAADVPVFLIDREANAEPCKDYITFIGSDFIEQGERIAEWLVEATGGTARIVELQGTVGASVTNDRSKGFKNVIGEYPDMEIIASQSGAFSRAGGQQVMEQLLGAYSDIDAVYAHNDEMAIGAIQAIKDAGLDPGEDIIVVSVDGTRDALEAITDGELGATVETNPRFGPVAFEIAKKYFEGESIPTRIVVQDKLFDKSNAAENVESAY